MRSIDSLRPPALLMRAADAETLSGDPAAS